MSTIKEIQGYPMSNPDTTHPQTMDRVPLPYTDDHECGTPRDPDLIRRYGAERLEQIERIMSKARSCGIRISTAESLTAGGIFSQLASLHGAGDVLSKVEGVYAKREKLRHFTIRSNAKAVSSEVAAQMALSTLNHSDSHLVVSTTGYAGEPLIKGTFREEPGTLFIGIAFRPERGTFPVSILETPKVYVQKYQLSGKNRTKDMFKTEELALDALEETLDKYIERQNAKGHTKKPSPTTFHTHEVREVEVRQQQAVSAR